MRLSWHEVWSEVAVSVARRSRCCRQQNGCVIVTPDNKMVASGYNGPPANWWPARVDDQLGKNPTEQDCAQWCERGKNGPTEVTKISYEDCPSLHAEANALMYSDASARRYGTMFLTSDPCWHCAKLIANSGLTELVVVNAGGREYRDPERNYAFLRDSGIVVVR